MAGGRIVVLSQDQILVSEILQSLETSFEILPAATAEAAEAHLLERSAWALVVDVSVLQVADDARAPKRFLRGVLMGDRNLRVITITPESGPALGLLDELTDSASVCHLRRPVTGEQIARVLRQLNAVEPDRDGLAAPPCRILRGRTRTFLTFTPELFPILDELELVAAHDVTVLLVGETGSGKTYLSQLVHELSPRFNERFLPLACGTLPPDLIESELFGHVRGSFTGAHADKVGKFAAAGSGTLLLDEIDVLTPDQQAKLLRVIETGAYEPVGSNTTQLSQARLIVASNQDLDPLVREQKFRQDLYYRLNVLKFHLPPLRDRKLDLVPLSKQFVENFAEAYHVPVEEVDPEFYNAIQAYAWPGNIRELENAIRRAIILCRKGRLTPDGLPTPVLNRFRGGTPPEATPAQKDSQTLNQYVALTEREVIEDALRRNKFKRTAAARSLGVSRVTLYNKMRKYGMMAALNGKHLRAPNGVAAPQPINGQHAEPTPQLGNEVQPPFQAPSH